MRLSLFPISTAVYGFLTALTVAQIVDVPPERREEIIVHPNSARPLDDWAQMQAHDAEIHRLKAKFDPDRRLTNVDAAAADRDFAAPGGVHALQAERDQPVVVDSQP
jgi:hypothetical protein